jgi:hypothetical protein
VAQGLRHTVSLPWRVALAVAVLVVGGLLHDASPAVASGQFVWPAEGRITQPFGCTGFSWEPRRGSCRHFHSGIDIANKAGTRIRAANSGVVKLVGYNPYDKPGSRAWVVVIQHDAGFTGWYAHMQPKYAPGVRAGQRVRTGQLIGYMGSTGRSTGVHLHFAFFRNGEPVNPARYLPRFGSTRKAAPKQAPVETTGADADATTALGDEDLIDAAVGGADVSDILDAPWGALLWSFEFEVLFGSQAVVWRF